MLLRNQFRALRCFYRTDNHAAILKDASVRTFTIQRESVDLSYSINKPASSNSSHPPLVILHGLFGNKGNWASLARRFCKELNRQIITVDARNHGNSPHHDKMDYHSMAADISNLLGKLNIKSAHILGHSMGGRTAMVLALNQPELFFSLIVEDVLPTSALTSNFPQIIQAMKRFPLKQPGYNYMNAKKIAMQYLEAVVPEAGVRAFLVANLVPGGKDDLMWRFNLDGIENDIHKLASWPVEEVEGLQYEGPTFFIGGSESKYTSDGDFINKDVMLKYFPMASTKVIPEAGHWVHSEQPKEFSNEVKEHIKHLEHWTH